MSQAELSCTKRAHQMPSPDRVIFARGGACPDSLNVAFSGRAFQRSRLPEHCYHPLFKGRRNASVTVSYNALLGRALRHRTLHRVSRPDLYQVGNATKRSSALAGEVPRESLLDTSTMTM